eukprot:114663-Amphidinium_carterae.1
MHARTQPPARITEKRASEALGSDAKRQATLDCIHRQCHPGQHHGTFQGQVGGPQQCLPGPGEHAVVPLPDVASRLMCQVPTCQ